MVSWQYYKSYIGGESLSAIKKLIQEYLFKNKFKTDGTFDDITRILTHFGFSNSNTSGGSHYKFTHPDLDYNLIIPKKNILLPAYIKNVKEALMTLGFIEE